MSERLYALRGATSVPENSAEAIRAATEELMRVLIERNELEIDRFVSCIFTATDDLNAEFPALAARNIGFDRVPLICTREIDVPGALPRVIRVLAHYYAPDGHVARHVYLGEARSLRADLDAAQ
ncbi:MAG: chorismate mutase [Solirubrobacteraceae bacterium]